MAMRLKVDLAYSGGQAGHYLSGLSAFLTKKSNPHLRQLITFEGGSQAGQLKDRFRVVSEQRLLVREVHQDWLDAASAKDGPS